VQGLPNGKLLTFFRLCVHQCWCHRCQKSFYESFPFLSSPKARAQTHFHHVSSSSAGVAPCVSTQ
jgi:hypothetical protein